MIHKVIRNGNHSLGVIIPAEFVHSLGIKAGDKVVLQTNMERGTINLKFTGAIQLHLPTSSKLKEKNK